VGLQKEGYPGNSNLKWSYLATATWEDITWQQHLWSGWSRRNTLETTASNVVARQ